MSEPVGHEQMREELAGYVLGGLTVDEQHAVEAHLAECELCRAELAELDPIPVLLDLASTAGEPAPEGPSAMPLTTVPVPTMPAPVPIGEADEPEPAGQLVAVGSATPPRRRRAFAGLTAALVGIAAAFLIGLTIATPSEIAYSRPVALAAAQGSAAHGTAALRPTVHGTDVRLELSGLPTTSGTYFECVWWSADKGVRSAGTFKASTAGTAKIELLTAASIEPGWRLEIVEHPKAGAAPMTVLQSST